MVRVLFWMNMNYDYNELIEPELEALAEVCGIKPKDFRLSHQFEDDGAPISELDGDGCYTRFTGYYNAVLSGECTDDKRVAKNRQNVFYYATVPSMETAIEIFDRCIQARALIDVWTEGQSYPDILNEVKKNHEDRVVNLLVGKRWCVKFNCFNAKTDASRVVSILEGMGEIFDGAGDVDLKNPETRIAIIERYKDYSTKDLCSIYFGNYIRDRSDIGNWWYHYSLSKRPILAPTSLENMLAFIMVNLGKVTKGSVVLDPFVGSGGSLIAASHFGAVCFGSDIDMRVLKGLGVGHHNLNLPPSDLPTNVYTNFRHYGLPLPEMLRFDNRHTVWKQVSGVKQPVKEWVDVIITDPPYGIRASAKNRKLVSGEAVDGVVDCFIDCLLNVAETMLVPGGRLVFLLPTKDDRIAKTLQIIKRPKLQIQDIGLQTLTGGSNSMSSSTILEIEMLGSNIMYQQTLNSKPLSPVVDGHNKKLMYLQRPPKA